MAGKTTYTQEIADTICKRIAEGESLVRICADDSMPSRETVYTWIETNPGNTTPSFLDNYTRARELQADTFFERISEIANDGAKDWVMSKFGPMCDQEHVNRSRLRVDTLKWQASKLAPKKYGDRVTQEVTGKDGGPVEFVTKSILED
jgi:hypothetical protein